MTDNGYVQALILFILGSAGNTLSTTASEVSLKKYTKEDYRSIAISFFTTAKYTVTLIGGIAIEILFNVGDDESKETYNVLFIGCTLLCASGVIASLILKELDVNYRDDTEVRNNNSQTMWDYTRGMIGLKRF